MILTLSNLHVRYGAIHAVHGVSLTVQTGEMVTLIGSNGAGKSTLLKAISGILKPSQGEICYQASDGKDYLLNRLEPHEIVKLGIAQVPEGRQIFSNLTVRENLELGAYCLPKKGDREEGLEMVFKLFPRLKERLSQNAGTLSGGEQQMLAIGRALMARPRLLLLDEPSLGLAPTLVRQIFSTLVEINKQGISMLLVEQDAYLALEHAKRGYVLETGVIILEGTGESLLQNDAVRKAYLGG